MDTKNIYERVIDLYEQAEGAFLIEGDLDVFEVEPLIAEYLDETMGKDGWSNLVVHRTATWRGGWEGEPLGDDRWVSRGDGDPWTYALTDYDF